MIVVFTTIIQTTDLAIQDLDQNKTHSKVDQLFHSFPEKEKERNTDNINFSGLFHRVWTKP